MTQADLNRAVAIATGETVNLIGRRGFSLLPRGGSRRTQRRARCRRTRPSQPNNLGPKRRSA
jgi:hypothetical protein